MADTLGCTVSSKTVCSSPNPQDLRMWPCIEIALCTYIQVKVRSHWIGVDLRRRGRFGHREHHVEMEMMLEWCLYKPRTPNIGATPRSGVGSSPQTSRGTSRASTLILNLQPPGRWELGFLLPKATQSVTFCSGRPRKPIQLIIWEIQWDTSDWWMRKKSSYFQKSVAFKTMLMT